MYRRKAYGFFTDFVRILRILFSLWQKNCGIFYGFREKGIRILYRFSTDLGKKAYGFFTEFVRMYRRKAYGFFTDFVRILRILFSLWQKNYGIFYGFTEKGLRILIFYRFREKGLRILYGFLKDV